MAEGRSEGVDVRRTTTKKVHGLGEGKSRWVGVGSSSNDKAEAAGQEAALCALVGEAPKLAIVFCECSYDTKAVVKGIRSVIGETPVVGSSTMRGFGSSLEALHAKGGVTVTILGGDGISVGTGSAVVAKNQLRNAAKKAVSSPGSVERRLNHAVLLFSDGEVGDQRQVARGAYEVLGAEFPLVGGCTGTQREHNSSQIHNEDVLEGGVVAAAISSEGALGIGIANAWSAVCEPILVTASRDNRLFELDGRPAYELYQEILDAPLVSTDDDKEAFIKFAMTHPLGVEGRDARQPRFIYDVDRRTGSLTFVSNIPEGGLVWFMKASSASVLEATRDACTQALSGLDDQPPLGLITFNCIARLEMLDEVDQSRDLGILNETAGGAPISQFYGYGEFARTSGSTGFHNQTVVVLAVG